MRSSYKLGLNAVLLLIMGTSVFILISNLLSMQSAANRYSVDYDLSHLQSFVQPSTSAKTKKTQDVKKIQEAKKSQDVKTIQDVPKESNSGPEKHKVAGLNCDRFGGPSEEVAAEMVYWSDIPQDATFVSPLAKHGANPKYLTFEPGELR